MNLKYEWVAGKALYMDMFGEGYADGGVGSCANTDNL